MLRAAVLHPVLRGIRRFSTASHPEALGACYVASWQLPRPDLHRSADDDFSGHTMRWLGVDFQSDGREKHKHLLLKGILEVHEVLAFKCNNSHPCLLCVCQLLSLSFRIIRLAIETEQFDENLGPSGNEFPVGPIICTRVAWLFLVWDTVVEKQIINGLFSKTEALMPIACYDHRTVICRAGALRQDARCNQEFEPGTVLFRERLKRRYMMHQLGDLDGDLECLGLVVYKARLLRHRS